MVKRTQKGWRVGLAATAAIALMAVSACGSSSTKTSAATTGSSNAIKIGVIVSTSGVSASLGAPEQSAIEAFSESHRTVNGHPLDFIIKNDQTDPTQSAALAKQFLADPSIDGLIAGTDAGPVLGMAPVLAGRHIPWLMLVPQPSAIYQKDPDVYWANNGNVFQQAALFNMFFQARGIAPTDSEMIISDDATGQVFTPLFTQGGIKHITKVPDTITDYTPLLSKLRGEGRKGIIVVESSQQSAGIRKAEAALGWTVPTILDVNALNGSYISIAGPAANGTYALGQTSIVEPSSIKDPTQRAASVAFQNAYKAQTGSLPVAAGPSPGWAWDAAMSYFLAAQKMTTISRSALATQMATQTFIGAGGPVKRTPNNPADPYRSGFQPSSYIYVEIRGGKALEVS